MGEVAPQIASLLKDLPLELLNGIFTDSARADLIRLAAAALFWKELRGIRKGLDAVVKRVDNHEVRLNVLEK